MRYKFNDKMINIPDEEIKNNMQVLELTEEEAIQVWLEDNEYLENEEQNQLCKKTKENRIMATIHQARAEGKRKTPSERVKKENPTKERIIAAIAEILPNLGANCIKIENIGKIITFSLENEDFKIDLIQKRKKKV